MLVSVLTAVVLLDAGDAPPAAPPRPIIEEPAPLFGLGANVGLTINQYGAAAHARVTGEVTFYHRPRNDLVGLVQVGSGLGLGLPTSGYYAEHYQHVAMAGFGYRSNGPLLSWGFQWAVGAVWYRAAFFPDVPFPPTFESRVVPYTEGRLQLGLRLAPSLRAGLYVGYGSTLYYSILHPGTLFIGGFMFGAYVDWR
jgi:hypothetical protein